jgi:hypothetical protein
MATPVNFSFVLIDLTTDATSAAMKPAPVFPQIIEALQEQAVQYGAAYGMPSVSFRTGTTDDRGPSENAINFRDTLPEAPGALAYHQVVNGVPDLEIGVDLFSTLTSGTESVSSGTSHEVLETYGDAGANGWKDKGTGTMGAEETADPVQNTTYNASNGVALSNFVRPSYFIPGAPGPWDYLGVMKSQDDISNGYEIQAGAPTTTTQVGGFRGLNIHKGKTVFIVGAEMTEAQRKRKSHAYSRTSRRGVRL